MHSIGMHKKIDTVQQEIVKQRLKDVGYREFNRVVEASARKDYEHRSSVSPVGPDGVDIYDPPPMPYLIQEVQFTYNVLRDCTRITVQHRYSIPVAGEEAFIWAVDIDKYSLYEGSDHLDLCVRQMEEHICSQYILLEEKIKTGGLFQASANAVPGFEETPEKKKARKEAYKELIRQENKRRADLEVKSLLAQQEKLKDPLVGAF